MDSESQHSLTRLYTLVLTGEDVAVVTAALEFSGQGSESPELEILQTVHNKIVDQVHNPVKD